MEKTLHTNILFFKDRCRMKDQLSLLMILKSILEKAYVNLEEVARAKETGSLQLNAHLVQLEDYLFYSLRQNEF